MSETPAQQTVVIDVAGRLTIGHDAKMRDAVAEALAAGARNLVMNMERVSRLDSSGIGELVAAHTSVRRGGGRFLLVGLSERLAAVLQITQVLGVLEAFEDMDAALGSLGESDDAGRPSPSGGSAESGGGEGSSAPAAGDDG